MAYLMHEGTPHEGSTPHSGRYPWGSGLNPNQRPHNFLEQVESMEKKGLSESEIAKGLNMSIRELRSRKTAAKEERDADYISSIKELRAKNPSISNVEIGRRLGIGESRVRFLDAKVNEQSKTHEKVTVKATADVLAKEVKAQNYIDVGHGVAESMGISKTRLDAAVQQLKDEGYEVHKIHIEQVGIPGQYTTVTVLSAPGTSWQEVRNNAEKIGIPNKRFQDPEGISLVGMKPIKSISSKRIEVAYAEDGGTRKDGVIELRRNVEGLSLGNARYAQVRIAVDGTHFLKGMAMYADDLPDGVDIRFNTNKSKDDPKIKTKVDTFKAMKTTPDGAIDMSNPFGAVIKEGGQRGYLNIVREEGDWTKWSKSLASQMLSKQSKPLAQKQLELTQQFRKQELDEINALTNPVVKKHLLDQYAEACDKSAVHLKAAAMPRQGSHVILPIDSIKPDQIYAPNYKNGERVVLIRYPHGGTFEIPELTVNNRNPEAKRLFSGAQDAVGIHHSVAERLSGADFDGDTVVVIPNNRKSIRTSPALKGLEGFDPKQAYPERKGMKYMSKANTQKEMGVISNLITDMTLQGATDEHLARAVRHSMVVIDAEKHKLDYSRSYKENGIEELKRIYQANPDKETKKKYGGASTLISRAKAEVRVPYIEKVQGERGIDPATGERLYAQKDKSYINKKGETVQRMTVASQMSQASDARALLSKRPTAMEALYADHANTMKGLANTARKNILATPDPIPSPEARARYAPQVDSLRAKLNMAVQHQPYERKAQILANHVVDMQRQDNPTMSKAEVKKARAKALTAARTNLGSKKPTIKITDKEWEAIQSGAVSKTMLKNVLNYADQDQVKALALPKQYKGLTDAKKRTAKMMKANGYSNEEIAARLGVSTSTISRAINE